MLKESLEIQDITNMLSSLNGRLDVESDDTIDDSLLYICFLSVLGKLGMVPSDNASGDADTLATIDASIVRASGEEAARCSVQCGADRTKLSRVLRIMVNAYLGVYFRTQAKFMLRSGD